MGIRFMPDTIGVEPLEYVCPCCNAWAVSYLVHSVMESEMLTEVEVGVLASDVLWTLLRLRK